MIRSRNFLPLIGAALVGAAVLGSPTRAHATLAIYLQEDGVNGGAITQVATAADFTTVTFGTGSGSVYGDFTVKVFGGSSDNDFTLSDVMSSTTAVTNNSGTSKTLRLYISQNNYTLPAGTPLLVESGLGGSLSTGSIGVTGIFQAYADKNNNLLADGVVAGSQAALQDFTNGPQTAVPNGTTFDTGSAFGTFNRIAGSDYSITSVANFTLSGHARANFSDHVNVTPAPEPSAVVLALTGLPVLGIGTWLRRRKAKAQGR